MKLFFKSIFCSICFFVFSPTVFAISDIPYCSEIGNYTCASREYSFGDFLNNIAGTYSPPYDFYIGDGYIYFEDVYFQFVIPDYVIESILLEEDFGAYFDMNDWMDIDENRNKVPDDIDDIIEMFKNIEDKYFGEVLNFYDFKKWDGKIWAYLYYNGDTTGFGCPPNASGCYWPDSDNEKWLSVDISFTKDYIKETIAHEMFHAIQNVYIDDFDAYWNSDEYDNFFEGTAVLMQRNIVSGSKKSLLYLEEAPYLYPQYSMFGYTPGENMANYGSFMWYNFLERKYGKKFILDLLVSYSDVASEYDPIYRSFMAVSNALENQATSITDAYLEYVTWNYDKDKYSYKDSLRDVYITRSHNSSSTGNIEIGADAAPALFASNYIKFDIGTGAYNLEVTFTANLDADMYLTFLSVNDGDVDYDLTINYFVERGKSEKFTIPSYGNDTVVMIVSVLDISDNASTTANIFEDYVYPYSYSAKRVSSVSESDVTTIPADIDLRDYFIFDSNKYWEYKLMSDNENTTDIIRYETLECTSKSGCITYNSADASSISYHYFGGSIYAFEVNEDEIDQVKVFSGDGVLGVLKKEAYPIFGLDGIDGIVQVSYSCSLSYDDGYNFNDDIDNAIIEKCKFLLIDDTGKRTAILSVNDYLENVGIVKTVVEYSYDSEVLADETFILIDTNTIELIANEISNNNEPDEKFFIDLDESHKNKDAILYLADRGIINGYPDGTFKPENYVNRAELLKILVEGKDVTPLVNDYSNCFPDVKEEWFAPYVCYAKEQGWVGGYPDGTFRPEQTVNKVEAIKMLLNSQGITLPGSIEEKPFNDINIDDWFAPFVSKAKQLGILEEIGSTFEPSKGMTRGSISENLYRLLTL